jgi:inositol transport system substrate-binding protein
MYYQERMMKTIYLLLTKTDTVLSKTIAKVTKDPFTHVALSLNEELTELYSFGRKSKYNPLNSGFVQEKMVGSVYEKSMNCNCAMYMIDITDNQYRRLQRQIRRMMRTEKFYKYNFLGLVYYYIGYEKKRDRKYFCSEFVSEMLMRIDVLPEEFVPEKTRPSDFTKLDMFEQVYTGTLGDLLRLRRVYN